MQSTNVILVYHEIKIMIHKALLCITGVTQRVAVSHIHAFVLRRRPRPNPATGEGIYGEFANTLVIEMGADNASRVPEEQ